MSSATDFLALNELLSQLQQRSASLIQQKLPPVASSAAPRLTEAMHYAALAGGKRIRPILVYAGAMFCNAEITEADIPAVAIELVHTYSLIHDDLPAMDNDNLRRGKPTCHIAFDEATAILAGDTLHTLAFDLLASAGNYSAEQRVAMIQTLSQAAGVSGMAAGQMLDIQGEDLNANIAWLENMHYLKTGRLITAALELGAIAANASPEQHRALKVYGDNIGLAFQIRDDMLDIIGATEELGKTQGSDERHNKTTFPGLIGLGASESRAKQLCLEAQEALSDFGDNANTLQQLASYIIARTH